jgi:hypothetical protein
MGLRNAQYFFIYLNFGGVELRLPYHPILSRVRHFLNKLGKLNTSLIYLCLLPLAAGAADYAENIGIITLLNNYPEVSNGTVTKTSVFSLLKSTGTTLYFLI